MIFIMFDPVDNKIILKALLLLFLFFKKREALITWVKCTLLLLGLIFLRKKHNKLYRSFKAVEESRHTRWMFWSSWSGTFV